MVQEDSPTEIKGIKSSCSLNKKPQMCSKKIPRRKRGQTEERTCSSAFSVAGIAFAFFVVVFLSVLVRARVGGGLAESYLARKKRELLVGCGYFAVFSQMPTAFTLLSDDYGFYQTAGRSLLIYSEVARNKYVGCKPWIPKALCCIHET